MGQKKDLRSIQVKYDPEADVLYCYFDKAREGVCVDVAEGVLLRVDPYDETKVVGFTILDLRERSLMQRGFDIPLDAELAKNPI